MNSSIIALIVILIFLVLVIIAIAHRAKPRLDKTYFQKHWQAIAAQEDYVRAVLKADALLDEALQYAKLRGTTTGERLNNAVGLIKDINATWSAHKLRNSIAHDVAANPTAIQCQKALRQYKKALKDLGAL
jgi:hypothetical protein